MRRVERLPDRRAKVHAEQGGRLRRRIVRQTAEVVHRRAERQRQLGQRARTGKAVVFPPAAAAAVLADALGKLPARQAGRFAQCLDALAEFRGHILEPWVVCCRISGHGRLRLLRRPLGDHEAAGGRAGVAVKTFAAAAGTAPLAVAITVSVHPRGVRAEAAGIRALMLAAGPAGRKLAHVVDRPCATVVNDPIQQPVLRLVIHAGDLERGGLGQLALLPPGDDARHLEALFDDLQIADLRRVDLHLLGDPVAQTDRERLAGLLAPDVGFLELLRLLREQRIGLHALTVRLDHRADLLLLRHRGQHAAEHRGELLRDGLVPVRREQPQRRHAAVAGDQAIFAVLRRHDGRRLEQSVGLDGLHQRGERLVVGARVEVARIVEDVTDRDLARHARIGQIRAVGQSLGKFRDVKLRHDQAPLRDILPPSGGSPASPRSAGSSRSTVFSQTWSPRPYPCAE